MYLRKRILSILAALILTVGVIPMPAGFVSAEPTCTVSFEPGEGTGSMADLYFSDGDRFVLPACGFTAPEGKRFDHWHIEEHDYDLQVGMSMPITVKDEQLTVTPVFEMITTMRMGTLSTGHTWRLVMTMKNKSGETYTYDDNGDWFFGGELTITGEGDLPDFTEEDKSPWDAILTAKQLYNYEENINVYFSSKLYSRLTIKLDDRITRIGDYSFTDPRLFGVVNLPAALTSIGDCAFYSEGGSRLCFDLDGKELPAIETIGEYAFANCGALTAGLDYPNSDSETYDFGPIILTGRSHVNGTLVLPDSLVTVGKYAFANTGVYEVKLPHGMTAVPEGMFKNCYQLNTVWLPDCLESIGDSAFAFCGMDYLWAGANGYGSAQFWDNNSFKVKPYTSVLEENESISLSFPAALTTLGEYAFRYCNSVRSVRIPENVAEIPLGCFAGCSELTNVELPEGLTAIRADAFDKHCQGKSFYELVDLYVPASVTVIEDHALGFSGSARYNMDVYGWRNTAAEEYAARSNAEEQAPGNEEKVITFHPLDEEKYYAAYKPADSEAELGLGEFSEPAAEGEGCGFDMTFTEAGLVAVKKYVKDKDGEREIWYALTAADDPGVFDPGSGDPVPMDTKYYKLTEIDDPELLGADSMISVPALTGAVLTLMPGDESFVRCELFRNYLICGEMTGWDSEELTFDPDTGLYGFSADLTPGDYGSFGEFTLSLNGVNYYSLDRDVFDKASERRLMTSEEIEAAGGYASDYRLYVSAAGTYKFVVDPESGTFSVISGNEGIFLCFGNFSAAMIDPVRPIPAAPGDPAGGDYDYPDAPAVAFEGEDTLWAPMRLDPNEVWNEETQKYEIVPYTFCIRKGETTLGKTAVEISLDDEHGMSDVIELGEDEYLLIKVDEFNEGVYDFYFGADSNKLVVALRPCHSIVYTGGEVTVDAGQGAVAGTTFDWYVTITEGSLLSDCYLNIEFDGDLIECTGVEWLFENSVLAQEEARMNANFADEIAAIQANGDWEPYVAYKQIGSGSVTVQITLSDTDFLFEGHDAGFIGGITAGGRLLKLTFRFKDGAELSELSPITIEAMTSQWGIQDGNLMFEDYERQVVADGYVRPETVLGDYDGDGVIEAEDALLVLRIVLSLMEADDECAARCDMNGDGVVDAVDALIILRKALGIV
ncbi:MAG: leucine-rich repeat protein [Clostridia bacterium]|nr:leucine-rich repeat protein [Clostridia bacterium]